MTQRLVHLAAQDWARFDGSLAVLGIDPLQLPPDRFLNAIYYWLVNGHSSDAVDKFNRRLWMPPKGVAPTRGPWSAEAETAAFQGFKKQFQSRRGGSA